MLARLYTTGEDNVKIKKDISELGQKGRFILRRIFCASKSKRKPVSTSQSAKKKKRTSSSSQISAETTHSQTIARSKPAKDAGEKGREERKRRRGRREKGGEGKEGGRRAREGPHSITSALQAQAQKQLQAQVLEKKTPRKL